MSHTLEAELRTMRRELVSVRKQLTRITRMIAASHPDLRKGKTAPCPRVAAVIDAVASETGVSSSLIMGRSRAQGIAYARKLVYRRALDAGLGLSHVARELGRDHSSVAKGAASMKSEGPQP